MDEDGMGMDEYYDDMERDNLEVREIKFCILMTNQLNYILMIFSFSCNCFLSYSNLKDIFVYKLLNKIHREKKTKAWT